MKKLSFFLLLTIAASLSFAQSEKYTQAMMPKIAALDSTSTPEGYIELANAFERIAVAEKTQWLPYYYAALSNVLSGYMASNGAAGGSAEKMDPLADKAETLLNKAEEMSKDNSEIYVVKKMIASLRLIADPMNRYMQYGPIAQQALETARKLNPENPRTYLLEGQDKLYTPEQYGGSKTEAKKLFETALQKYETFKPETAISPAWGKTMTQYFISQAQ
jgi:hypothetical protein